MENIKILKLVFLTENVKSFLLFDDKNIFSFLLVMGCLNCGY